MSDPSKPASEQLLATGGGNATAGGVTFQAEVGALFAVHLIAEQRLSPRLELGDVRARSLRFETEAPVDDILIETDAGGCVFVLAGVAPGAVGVDFGRRSASKPVLGPAVGRTRGSAPAPASLPSCRPDPAPSRCPAAGVCRWPSVPIAAVRMPVA